MINRKLTLFRVIFFCLLNAIIFATISGLVKNFSSKWNQHLLLAISIVITYGLTILFTKWEKLQLKNVGVVASSATFKKLFIGFGIGLFMTLLQPVLVLL